MPDWRSCGRGRCAAGIGLWRARGLAADFEILEDGEIGEDAAVLRYEPEAHPRDRVGLRVRDVAAEK